MVQWLTCLLYSTKKMDILLAVCILDAYIVSANSLRT